MKVFALSVVISMAIAGLSMPAAAQTPSVTGTADYNSSHHTNFYYWSVYGSNLSTGYSEVNWIYYEGPPGDYNGNDWVPQEQGESKTLNTPAYWYESSSQINFYFFATTGIQGYVLEEPGELQVCNKNNGLCSSWFDWYFN